MVWMAEASKMSSGRSSSTTWARLLTTARRRSPVGLRSRSVGAPSRGRSLSAPVARSATRTRLWSAQRAKAQAPSGVTRTSSGSPSEKGSAVRATVGAK